MKKKRNMKRYIYGLIILLGMTGLSACMDENAMNKEGTHEEGIPTTVTLSFAPNTPQIETRAGDNMDDEYGNKVFDITIYAFDKDGELIRSEARNYTSSGQESTGTVADFKTVSGVNYIFAVANLEAGGFLANSDTKSLKDQLDESAARGKDAFLNQSATLTQNSVTLPDGHFLMSGSFVSAGGTSSDGKVVIQAGNPVLNGKIQLTRVVSSVTFNISSGSGVSFTPQTWQVMELPQSSYLFGKSVDFPNSNYFSMATPRSFDNGKTLIFYMMENRKVASQPINRYKDRFSLTVRPANSTYVVLKGYFNGTADRYPDFNKENAKEENIKAEGAVTYYIPLGNVGSNASSGSLQDYNTNRNTQYIYNITINGVNDIVVEVILKDPTSVADGDIYYTDKTGEIITLDAHYEARLLKFTKTAYEASKVGYMVKSPVTNFEFLTHMNGADKDKDWVKFMINPSDSKTKLSDYPGDRSGKLYTIDQLLEYINTHNPFDTNGDLYITAFIDEYYYDQNDYPAGDPRRMNWTEFANKPNREMLLLCRTAVYNDGQVNNSSLTESAYVLSQRSIQTYYVTDGKAEYAVGIEWTNETNLFEKSTAKQNNTNAAYYYKNSLDNLSSSADGRLGMMTDIWGYSARQPNTNWKSVVYLTNDLAAHKEAYNACMSRNRNTGNKGDNVKKEEVKWFLPSYQQYQSTVLGQSGYAQEAVLFPPDTQHQLHFYTTGCNIIWAEEGMSYSTKDQDEYPGDKRLYHHSVRCMRYLGSTEAPALLNYATVENTQDGVMVRLDKLNNSSKREKTGGELVIHSELDQNDKPYKAFIVNKKNTLFPNNKGEMGTWEDLNNYVSTCPAGWRIPNQREMSIMMINKDAIDNSGFSGWSNLSSAYVTRTKYSRGTGFDNVERSGFVYSGVLTIAKGSKGYLRCVKDAD